jgi:hypothetical protein
MPQTLRTTTGQFSSSGGRTQLRAANVRAVEPAPNLPGPVTWESLYAGGGQRQRRGATQRYTGRF